MAKYVICVDCNKRVKLGKFIFGDLHFCKELSWAEKDGIRRMKEQKAFVEACKAKEALQKEVA